MCHGIRIEESIAAGCSYAGFVAPGHTCGEALSQQSFRSNVAHSVSGSGALIFPDPSDEAQKSCYEGSQLFAYKNSDLGVGAVFDSQEIRMSNMVLVDNTFNINIQVSGSDDQITRAVFSDSFIFGESGADDCPLTGHDCYCKDKGGMMLFSSRASAKDFHVTQASELPIYNIKSDASWHAETLI